MNGYLIFPLTKSAWRKGRIGQTRLQDWYRGLVKAKELHDTIVPSKILILSNGQYEGQEHEVDSYLCAAVELEINPDDLIVRREGVETIEQLDIARKLACELGVQLIVVSTWLHYPRAHWLLRRSNTVLYGAFGIPRPCEIIIDMLLLFVFPVIDMIGGRNWFQSLIKARRESGKF